MRDAGCGSCERWGPRVSFSCLELGRQSVGGRVDRSGSGRRPLCEQPATIVRRRRRSQAQATPRSSNLVVGGGMRLLRAHHRRELLWQVGLWLPSGSGARGGRARTAPARAGAQSPHRGNVGFGGLAAAERLLAEYAVLGFAASLPSALAASPRGAAVGCGTERRAPPARARIVGRSVRLGGRRVSGPKTAKGFIFVLDRG